jgi:hypothetical protein
MVLGFGIHPISDLGFGIADLKKEDCLILKPYALRPKSCLPSAAHRAKEGQLKPDTMP